jgi:hypothetical protein
MKILPQSSEREGKAKQTTDFVEIDGLRVRGMGEALERRVESCRCRFGVIGGDLAPDFERVRATSGIQCCCAKNVRGWLTDRFDHRCGERFFEKAVDVGDVIAHPPERSRRACAISKIENSLRSRSQTPIRR